MPASDVLLPASAPAAALRFWSPRRKRLWTIYAAGAVLLAGYSAISDWRDHHAVLINASGSLPNWAFLIDRGTTPRRGDVVAFDPPRTPLVIRHFGQQPAMFAKIVYGVGGDTVTRSGRTFFVNGRKVAVAKERSRFGEPLALGPTGTIPAGCYFVGTPHKDGFDSRYAGIGWPCSRWIIGTGTPIL
jgi:conjugal transfer pilin signal peptidase TrbI